MMNPVPGPAAGWPANPPSFPCPMGGCGRIYTGPEALRYHMDTYHAPPPAPPYQHTGRGQQQSRNGAPHPLRQTIPVSPMNATFQQPIYNAHPSGPAANIPQSLPPTHDSMPPPPVQNQVPRSDSAAKAAAAQKLTDREAYTEALVLWPPTAQSLLKDLIISHGFFTPPSTPQDHDKLVGLYESFYADTKTLGMNLASNDDILWQLFRTKLDMIQGEMLRGGEVQQTPFGLKHVKLPQKKSLLPTPGKEPLSTPPTTPVLPMEQFRDEMEVWNSSDSNAQARLFRKMLRTAKDPQRLIFELDQYCAETRPEEDREAKDDIRPPSNPRVVRETETDSRSTQRPTPSKTPDPTSTNLDLKAMIEKSLREMRQKRALEKQILECSEDEVGEALERKRIKTEAPT